MNKLTLVLVATLAIGCGKKTGNDAGAAIAKMTEFKNEMCKCKDTKCAQDVSDRMTKWTQEQSKDGQSQPKFDEAQQKKASELGTQLGACMATAMTASTPPPPAGSDTAAAGSAGSAGSAATVTGLPKECDEYKAQVEKLRTCDKLPAAAKETLLKAYNDAAAGWAALPEGARSGLDVSCKRGTQALIDSVKEACGW